MFREGLQTVPADHPDLEVVAAVPDGAAAIEAVERLRPDVVLMDLHMPGVGGLEATARLATTVPDAAVVVLTMNEDADAVFAVLRAGARGYLIKEADAGDIVRAVRSVADGEAVFGARVADQVLRFFSAGSAAVSPFPS